MIGALLYVRNDVEPRRFFHGNHQTFFTFRPRLNDRIALVRRPPETLDPLQFLFRLDQNAAGRQFPARSRQIGNYLRIRRQCYRRTAVLIRVERFSEPPHGFAAPVRE